MLRALIMLLSNFSVGALPSLGIMTTGTIEVGSWAIRIEPYRAGSNQDAFCDPFESARGGISDKLFGGYCSEDPVRGVIERKEVGYTISREDVGRWIWDSVLGVNRGKWTGRVASIAH